MVVQNGRVVGDLTCQFDSYLQVLDVEVISCEPAPKQAPISKKKPDQHSHHEEEWLIECTDSILFPEGGGQPSDHGTLTPLSGPDQNPISIKKVQRQGLRCIIHSPQPLSPGDKIRQAVDWKRRWDHMQQHTGQHLLSAVMMNQHGLETLGWGMGTERNMNYVDLPRKPTEEEMQEIQNSCTELIRDNLPITVETPDDAKHDRLPTDYDKSDGVVRVIHIGDLDTNTQVPLNAKSDPSANFARCCGTHLSQTSHISLIILGSTQSVHGKNCRLFFAAGDRAIALATSSVSAINTIARLTSSSNLPSEVVTRTKTLFDSVADLRRSEKKLLLEVASFESEKANQSIRNGTNAYIHRHEGSTEFINKIVGETKEALQGTGCVVVIALGEPKGSGPVVIVGDAAVVDAMAQKVKMVVKDIKGGGARGRWQGKVSEWTNAELVALKEAIES